MIEDSRAKLLLEVLQELESHHVALNRSIGRDDGRSKTLSLVRKAIEIVEEANGSKGEDSGDEWPWSE